MSSTNERRETARLSFPIDLHPVLDLPFGEVRILDYHASGVRFALPAGTDRPKVGASLIGTARFGEVHQVAVSGIVVWTTRLEVGLALDPPGIPDSVVDAGLDSLARLV